MGALFSRQKGFRMIAYGVDALLMQGALAHGIKLLQGTVTTPLTDTDQVPNS